MEQRKNSNTWKTIARRCSRKGLHQMPTATKTTKKKLQVFLDGWMVKISQRVGQGQMSLSWFCYFNIIDSFLLNLQQKKKKKKQRETAIPHFRWASFDMLRDYTVDNYHYVLPLLISVRFTHGKWIKSSHFSVNNCPYNFTYTQFNKS
jgi:hypothetical protein